MANIATLAVKIYADIADLTKNARDVIGSIDNIAKVAEKATPAMKNLEDSSKGLGIMLDAVAEAKKHFESVNNSKHSIEEINEALDKYEKLRDASGKIFDATVKNAGAAAEAIKKLPPSIESAEKAFNVLDTAINALNMNGLPEVWADLKTMQDAVKNASESTEVVLKGMALQIKEIPPDISNMNAAFGQVQQIRDLASTFQTVTGDVNAGTQAIRQAEEAYLQFISSTAGGIQELPLSVEKTEKVFRLLDEAMELRNKKVLTGIGPDLAEIDKTIQDVINSIDNMSNATKKAASSGLKFMLDATGKAYQQLMDSIGNGADTTVIDNARTKYEALEEATKKTFDVTIKNAGAAVDAISKLPPSIENTERLFQKLQEAMDAREMMKLSGIGIDTTMFDTEMQKMKTSAEGYLSSMAVKINEIPPGINNMETAIKSANQVIGDVTALQKLTGDINAGKSVIQDATNAFGNFTSQTAGKISQLTPTIDNIKSSFDTLNQAIQQYKVFQKLGADTTVAKKGIIDTKNALQELASKQADDILNFVPTVKNVMAAQREVQKLIKLRDQLKASGQLTASMDAAIQKAQQNVAVLSGQAAQYSMELAMMKSTVMAINNMPFTIVTKSIQDLYGWIASSGNAMNVYLNGAPGKITKIITVLGALIIVIGLMFTKVMALNGGMSAFTALVKSSVIYQGFAGFVSMISGVIVYLTVVINQMIVWIAAQWQLNIAMTANPIGAIVVGIGVIVALVVGLVYLVWSVFSWWSKSEQKAAELKNQIKMTENATADFRDRIGESVERYKELNKLAKQYHTDNLTDLQKYENKLKEIDEVLDKNNVANDAMKAINLKNNELVKMMDTIKKTGNKDAINSLQKLIDDVEKDRIALQKEMKKSQVLSAEDATAAKEKARLVLLQSQFGDLLKETLTPQEQYIKTLDDLKNTMEMVAISENEQKIIKENATKKFIDSLGIKKLIEAAPNAQSIYNENMEKLQTALKAGAIVQEQYNNGLENSLKLLADDLGVGEWVGTKTVKTLQQAYDDIATYMDKSGGTMRELIEAQGKAKAAFEKQSESYSLYQKAQDALLSSEEKVKKAFDLIDKDAAAFGWEKEVTDKMKMIAEAEIMGKQKEGKQKDNQVIVRGSTAYTDYQNKNLGNDHLKTIRDNSKKQNDLLSKNIEAVKETGEVFKKCFEVIG